MPNCEDKTLWQDVGYPVGNTTLGILPNITGAMGSASGQGFYSGGSGALYGSSWAGARSKGEGGGVGNNQLNLDASRSSNVYVTGADRVVPCSINIRFIIKY